MLIRTQSSTNHTIFLFNDRQLCSRVDPKKEAVQWVDFYSKSFADAGSVIILGLGCGYHVVETIKRFPSKKVVVIEANPELATLVKNHFSIELAASEIWTPKGVEELICWSRFQKILTKPFYVAENKTVTFHHSPFFEDIKSYLFGRDKQAFQYHLRLREELNNIFDMTKIFLNENSKLSIKDLVDSIKQDQITSQASAIIHCLREFIL